MIGNDDHNDQKNVLRASGTGPWKYGGNLFHPGIHQTNQLYTPVAKVPCTSAHGPHQTNHFQMSAGLMALQKLQTRGCERQSTPATCIDLHHESQSFTVELDRC